MDWQKWGLVCLFIGFTFLVYGQHEMSGVPFTTSYNNNNYGYHGQTWATVKSPQGDMMIAHDKGILIFTGHDWSLMKLPNNSSAISLKLFKGRIFVGGYHEMGYIDTDAKGAYQYNSLRPAGSSHQTVWDIACEDSVVYFRTSKGIVMHDFVTNQTLEKEDERYTRFLKLNNHWRVMFYGDGIYDLNPELFISDSIAPLRIIKEHMFYFALPYQGTVSLVYAFPDGFMLYNSQNNKLTKWHNELEQTTDFRYVYRGVMLRDGKLAFTIPKKGLFVLNKSGQILDIFNRNNVFTDNIVMNIYEDEQGDLWLNNNNGVLFMEYSSPLRRIDRKYNFLGYPEFLHTYNDSVFVGTTSGLYKMALSELNGPDAQFEAAITDIMCLHSCSFRDGFLLSTNDSVMYYPDKRAVVTVPVNHFFSPAYDSNLVIAGTELGLMKLIYTKGMWSNELIQGFSGDVLTLFSSRPKVIWIKRSYKGVWRLELSDTQDSVVDMRPATDFPGLKAGGSHSLFELDNTPVVSGEGGVFKWNAAEKQFEPFPPVSDYLPTVNLSLLERGPDSTIWFWKNDKNSFGGTIREVYNGVVFDTVGLKRMEQFFISDIDFLDNNTVLTTNDFLAIYSKGKNPIHKHLKISVASVYDFLNDTLIRQNPQQFSDKKLILSPGVNDLRFHVHSGMMIQINQVRYSFYLENYNEKWSSWQKSAYKEYGDLPAGQYALHVKAIDHHGHESVSKPYEFYIEAPWYLSDYAFVAFAIGLLLFIWMIIVQVKLYNKRERERLEQKIRARTKELQKEKEILRSERDKIDEMNATKDKFFSIIAHDLRSPFNSMLGLSEVLQQDFDYLDDSEKKEIVDNIHKTSNLSFSLLDNLLTWSRAQRNKVDIYPGFHDLTEVLQESLNLLESTIKAKNITVNNFLSTEYIGFFDKNMALTIIRNLISNAIKFTEAGGLIETEMVADNDELKLHVKDNGIGISDKDLKNLFDTGKQTKRKGTQNEAGTGLGLLLCKDFAEQNNGRLEVKSELKRGSVFTLVLPRTPKAKRN